MLNKTVIVDCARCGGDGIKFKDPDRNCIACGGRGKVRVIDPPEACGRCGGDGLKMRDPNHICIGCGGCGWVTI